MNNSFFSQLGKQDEGTIEQSVGQFGSVLSQLGKPALKSKQPPTEKTGEELEAQVLENPTQELPSGALGFNEDGTPNYGEGIQGWYNGMVSRVWEPTETGEEKTGAQLLGASLWEGASQVLNVFGIPQRIYYDYLADRRSLEMQADMVNSTMPDIYQDNEMGNFLRIITSMIPSISNLTTMYEKQRIKSGTRRLPQADIDLIKKANRIWNKDNVGTAIINTTVQTKYIQDVLAGEDPYKLTKAWGSPVSNLIADIILDPLNVFDGLGLVKWALGGVSKGSKVAKGAVTAERFVSSASKLEKGEDVVETIAKLSDEISVTPNMVDEANKIAGTALELTQDSKRVVIQDKANGVILPLLLSAKGDVVKLNDWLIALGKVGSGDKKLIKEGLEILQTSKIAHLMLSDNAIETAQFLYRMQDDLSPTNIKKLVEVLETGDTKKFVELTSELMGKYADDMYPDVNKIIDKVDEIAQAKKEGKIFAKDIPEGTSAADIKKLKKEGKLIDPSLEKFENFKMSKTTRTIARIHKRLQTNIIGGKGVKDVNEFLSLAYLSSPGFVVRNMLNAIAQSLYDLGLSGGAKTVAGLVGDPYKELELMFGLAPQSIVKAFGMGVIDAAGGASKVKTRNPFKIVRNWAGEMEKKASAAVAGKAGNDYANAMLKRGKHIENTDTLVKAGFSQTSADMLEKLIRTHKGDTGKAIKEFMEMFKNGKIEHFREPELIFNEQLLSAINKENGLLDKLRSAFKSGTLDDIETALDDIIDDYVKQMKSTDNIVTPDLNAPESVKFMDDFSGVSDEIVDQQSLEFGQKVAMRRNLESNIDTVARTTFNEQNFVRYSQGSTALANAATREADAISTSVRTLSDDLATGRISLSDAKKKLRKDPIFKNMNELSPSKHATIDEVKDALWKYRTREVSNVYTNATKAKYSLYNSLKPKLQGSGALRKTNKITASLKLDELFQRSIPYLEAKKFENGKVFLNRIQYHFERGDLHQSLLAYADELGLERHSAQRGKHYVATWYDVINRELGEKVGDVYRPENYRKAMDILSNYAPKRAKLLHIQEKMRALKRQSENILDADMQPVYNDISKFIREGSIEGADELIERAIAAYKKGDIDIIPELEKVADDVIMKTPSEAGHKLRKLKGGAADDKQAMDMLDNALSKPLDDIPHIDDGQMVTNATAKRENWEGYKKMMDNVRAGIKQAYGSSEHVSSLSNTQAKALKEWALKNESKMVDFRTKMLSHMKETRDMVMIDYAGGKRNLDVAAAYLLPYQFWYSRTYGHWMKRIASNPAVVNRYNAYREYIRKENEDLPEYMRNNIVLGETFGFAEGNELIFNLEASVNPINGITGIDFTDKNKIVGEPGTLEYALTSTIDGIGKFGPSTWTPISVALAAYLSSKGEKDAAARWAGRMLPQTAPLKALASKFGLNAELDPFVALFGEGTGTDPYERRRVGRALMGLVESGQITKEQAMEAARTSNGEVWEKAVVAASSNRAGGTLSSYMLGVGMKARTKNDAEIDKFYEDYFKMWANSDQFSPDEMRTYQQYIHKKYPFSDLVLLSAKGSDERDKAYVYSVLSRIAPGQQSDIMGALGVNPDLVQKFYDDKGDMDAWNPLDKEAFLNASVQIGTLVSIPSDTTLEKWQEVKATYRYVNEDMVSNFGDDILDKIDVYYSYEYGSIEQEQYMKAHPEVGEAMNFRDYLIGSNSILAPYYDGFDKIERYYDGLFRADVEKRIPNYYDYYKMRNLIIDPQQLKAFEREVGWSGMYKQYLAVKKEWDGTRLAKLNEYDRFFPQTFVGTGIQEGVEPSIGQQSILETIAPAQEQPQITWQQISETIPIPQLLEKALSEYFSSNRIFTSSESTMVQKLTNVVNETYGLDLTRDEVLDIASQKYGTITENSFQ